MKRFRYEFRIGLLLFLGGIIFLTGYTLHWFPSSKKAEAQVTQTTAKPSLNKEMSSNQKKISKDMSSSQKTNDTKAKVVNWLMPTGGAYPVIGPNDPIWIKVSKEAQRVYIMKGNEVIYTMVCSSGLDTNPDTSTPVGTFYIQAERGLSFYNSTEKEGAKYWVSWKNHGEFLFHSVATDVNGNVIPSEAMKLGHKASHGCIRLAVPDAKWIYDNIRFNTKVVVS